LTILEEMILKIFELISFYFSDKNRLFEMLE
jgi:hypothetical protein